MSKLKILISGSCGLIFSNFIRKVIYDKCPYSIVSIDRVNSNATNSIYFNKDHQFYIADINDQHIINTIFQFEQPDIVIHGAAETEGSFLTSNVIGTQNIINACLKNKVKKIIYVSDYQVYGSLNENNIPKTETDPINPETFYAASKASGELLIKAAAKASGLIYNIVRPSNCYGPRQSIQKLIPGAIKSILNNEQISIYGKGDQIRDWSHVFDVCSGILTVLQNGKDNEIYNISAGQEFPTVEVIQEVCNSMKSGHNLINFIKNPQENQAFRYAINPNKLKELGWKPNFKFKNGIIGTVKWFSDNQWVFK